MELFLSYARQDQARALALQGRLTQLGHSVWVDQRLTGGQQWWNQILRQIAACDALVLVVSHGSLRSRACAAEREYAAALGRPILPVLVEHLPPEMLPADIQLLHLVDYTWEGADAAIRLAGAVAQLPAAPPLPDPLPPPPPVPLSYLSQLGHKLAGAEPLDLDQQVAIAARLEAALRSPDAEERNTARELMWALRQRPDLLAETQRMIDRNDLGAPPAPSPVAASHSPAGPYPSATPRSPAQPHSPGQPHSPAEPFAAAGSQSFTPPQQSWSGSAPMWSGPPQAPGFAAHPPGATAPSRSASKAWLWVGVAVAAVFLLCLCLGAIQCSSYGC